METNHEKIQAHIKKYNRTYWLYFLAYIIILSLALILYAPTLLIGMLILSVIHILTKCVDVAELDYLKNKQKFDDLKDRHDVR